MINEISKLLLKKIGSQSEEKCPIDALRNLAGSRWWGAAQLAAHRSLLVISMSENHPDDIIIGR